MTASMIDAFCVTPAVWNALTGSSSIYGTPAYGADQAILVKVVHKEVLLRSARTGQQLTSNTQIEFNPSWGVNVGDKITVDGSVYEVEKLNIARMFDVDDHKHAILIIMG